MKYNTNNIQRRAILNNIMCFCYGNQSLPSMCFVKSLYEKLRHHQVLVFAHCSNQSHQLAMSISEIKLFSNYIQNSAHKKGEASWKANNEEEILQFL